jgi:hypothetical protein
MATTYNLTRPGKETPNLYATEGLGDKSIVQCHYFLPGTSIDWYVLEYDPESDICFSWAEIFPDCGEYGYTKVSELEQMEVRVPIRFDNEIKMITARIELDSNWVPKTIEEVLENRTTH